MAQVCLDTKFGMLKKPAYVDDWEDTPPDSLCVFDGDRANALKQLKLVTNDPLLRSAATTITYLWAMKENGDIMISVEELALRQSDTCYTGVPRRRAYKHPAEDRKLGHPTLVSGGEARIAGELALDIIGGTVKWVLNANSGRYCKSIPPSKQQLQNIANKFEEIGLAVLVDSDY